MPGRLIPRPLRFSHDGRTLEVRASPLAMGWSVGIYAGSQAVTRIRYVVLYETEVGAGTQAVNLTAGLIPLMEHARDEVLAGRIALAA
jgi:hypothetical protein